MLVIFYLLLMLRVGRCADDQTFDTKTAGVGNDVKLTCKSKSLRGLFWIRLVSGNVPEVLGRTFSFHSVDPRIKTSEEPGGFVLHIQKTKLSDTGVFYCVKTEENLIFLSGTDLRIVEPAHNQVGPTDSVPLQYSVLSDSDNKICPGDHSVCLFGSRSDESHPSVVIKGSSVGENERNSYCGEIFCVNRSTLVSEVDVFDSQKNIILSLLCVALAMSLISIAVLLCSNKKLKEKSCHCNAAPTESIDHQSEQRDEDALVYSTPTFNQTNAGNAGRGNEKAAEGETVYSDV